MNEIIKKNGITFGIIGGLISILTTVFAYIYDLKLFASLWLLLFFIITYITLYIVVLSKTKKQLNNVFTFKEAFTTFFITMTVAVFLSTLFNIILFNVIDTELASQVKEIEIESAVSWMKKYNTPNNIIKEKVIDIEKTDKYTFIAQIKGMVIGILIFSIFGLILAAIFKSKPTYQE